MDNIPNFQEDLLPEYLVQTGIITTEQLALARRRLDKYNQLGRTNLYTLDQQNYTFLESDARTGQVLHTINLPKDLKNLPKYLSIDWVPIGSGNAFLYTGATGRLKLLSEIKWESMKEIPGIAVENGINHLFLSGKESYYYALVNTLFYEGIPLKKIKCLPLDMTISPDGAFIYIADRGLGRIYIVDTAQKQLVGTLIIRSQGVKKTLNIACLKDNSKILVADNHSPALFLVNTRNLKIKRNPLAYGALGNLILSNDNSWLYILSIRRGGFCELLILDTLNFILKASVPLKGRVFSSLDDPCDLIALSPDNNWLLVMTYTDSPALFTPLINVIDINSYSLEDTITLDYDNKPAILTFGIDKQRERVIAPMTLIDVLLTMKVINENNLATARASMIEAQSIQTDSVSAWEESIKIPAREDYSFLQDEELDSSLLVSFKEKQLLKLQFIPVNNINNIFKVAAVNPDNEEMKNLLQNKFENSILQFIKIDRTEFERFIKEFYPFVRQKYFDIMARYNMPVNKPLESGIKKAKPTEDELKQPSDSGEQEQTELSPYMEVHPLAQYQLIPKPAFKIDLQQVPPEILEKEIIAYCLMEFIKIWNVDIIEQELNVAGIKAAALKASNELAMFDYTLINIPDMYKNYSLETVLSQEKLMEMLAPYFEQYREMSAEFKLSCCAICNREISAGTNICHSCNAKKLKQEEIEFRGISSPDPLIYLPLGHLLIVDPDGKRVIETDAGSEIVWHYGGKDERLEHSLLTCPQDTFRLSSGNTLIVDTGEDRIIEVSKTGRVHWELNPKHSSSELAIARPVKAIKLINGHTLIVDQGHHRVFEINSFDKIVWQYGISNSVGISDNRLYNPNDVQRLPNKHTIITDTDNHRVIELDKEDKIIWQYGNKQNKLGSGYGMNKDELNSPLQAIRLPDDKNTLIVDSGNFRIIEINMEKQILWCFFTKQDNDSTSSSTDMLNFAPLKILRREPANIVIFGEQLFIEIDKHGSIIYIKYYSSLPYSQKMLEEAKKRIRPAAHDVSSRINKLAKQASKTYKHKIELEDIEIPLVDRHHNKIYIVNRAKQILWRLAEIEEHNPLRLERPQAAELLSNGYILVADTDRHRVMEIYRPTKEIIWQYGITGAMGSGENQLGHPRSATLTADDTILISDQYSSRVIEVSREKELIWSYGGWEEGVSALNAPYFAERTKDGTALITDWSNHTILEVNKDKEIVWQYGIPKTPGHSPGELMYPERATRLPNGNTLICDTRNNRVIEVMPDLSITWMFGEEPEGKTTSVLNNPTVAFRLKNSDTVIVHNNNKQICEVTQNNEIVWQYELPAKF